MTREEFNAGLDDLVRVAIASIEEGGSDDGERGVKNQLLAEFDRLKLCEATLLSLMQSMAPAPTYTPPAIDFGFRSPLADDIVRTSCRGTGIAGIGGEQ
jgi:hypothetical protein